LVRLKEDGLQFAHLTNLSLLSGKDYLSLEKKARETNESRFTTDGTSN